MPELSKCRSCGAPIIWIKTASGKNMPVDAEPSPIGNIPLSVDGEHVPYVEGETLHVSHFATCPDASKHRKAK